MACGLSGKEGKHGARGAGNYISEAETALGHVTYQVGGGGAGMRAHAIGVAKRRR